MRSATTLALLLGFAAAPTAAQSTMPGMSGGAEQTQVAEAVTSPPPPNSAIPVSEPSTDASRDDPESAAENRSERTDQGEAGAEVNAASEIPETAPDATAETATEEMAVPEPPPAPEPPEAPAAAAPAEEPAPAETDTAETAEPVSEGSAAANEPTAEAAPSEASDQSAVTEESGSEQPQQAVLTTGDGPLQGGLLRVLYASGESALPEDAKSELKALAQKLLQEEGTQIQMLAYAQGDDSGPARRLATSRAMEVRNYLIDQGVRATRMEVQLLGNEVPDGPPDRVDIQAAVR